MTPTLHYVVCAAVLTLLSLLLGSFFRNRLWTGKGLQIGLGNRNEILPPSAVSGRADRAAMNTLENFVLFAALALTAHAAELDNEQVALGAKVFLWARLVYLFVYIVGIPYLRTVVWAAGLVGLCMMTAAMY